MHHTNQQNLLSWDSLKPVFFSFEREREIQTHDSHSQSSVF